MKIRDKLIIAFLSMATLFAVVGGIGVNNTTKVGDIFAHVETIEVPSLVALLELIAATRQASIKAMEYSMRGSEKDRQKAQDALVKVNDALTAYKLSSLKQNQAKRQSLENKVQIFIAQITSYLKSAQGPALDSIITEEERLHSARNSLIDSINKAIKNESSRLAISLLTIKSEARKVSIKAIEFAMRGRQEDKTKSYQAVDALVVALENYSEAAPPGSEYKINIEHLVNAYIAESKTYIDQMSLRSIPVSELYAKEKEVHEARKALVHELYPIIEKENRDFKNAAMATRDSIKYARNTLLILIFVVVIIALILGLAISRSILQPIARLGKAAAEVGQGRLDTPVDIESNDEVGKLAYTFKEMTKELKINRDHLEDMVALRTEALEASNRELESYSYTIAHDLRAPLRSVTSFSQIVLEDAGPKLDEESKGQLQRVVRAGKHMAHLVDDLLELSRISRLGMKSESISLSKISKGIANKLSESQPDRKVHWRVEDDLMIKGDPVLMGMVIDNLLGNAWKYTSTREQAEIEFGSTVNNNHKIYYVKDNGVGFDMRYVDKIFGVFQRLHRTDEYEGTGVGLATAQRIIHRHGGRIWAEGELDKGASIFFELPENDKKRVAEHKHAAV